MKQKPQMMVGFSPLSGQFFVAKMKPIEGTKSGWMVVGKKYDVTDSVLGSLKHYEEWQKEDK